MVERLAKLRQELEKKNLDAILIAQPENRRYLSSFTGSAGYLVVSQKKAVLATDFRYIQQAKEQSPDWNIFRTLGDINKWLPEVISDWHIENIGFESRHISYAVYQQLVETMSKFTQGVRLVAVDALVEQIRAIKDDGEIASIMKAAKIADDAFDYILTIIHPDMTEKEAAWQIERFLRDNGSESVPFEIIAASGPHSSLPHAQPSDRVFHVDEPILFDFGAKIEGYCSDLSRTVCLSSGENQKFSEIYNIVLEAQMAAINQIQAGISVGDADSIARSVIRKYGYGDFFGHSLGHGIGLATHESPVVGPLSTGILNNNMIFTVEPGIYLSDWGGIRIEDTVILKNDRITVLSKADKLSGYF